MALQPQELVIPLGVTMNEGVPRELLPVGQLHNIENGRVRKTGKLEKRYGYTLLSSGTGVLNTGSTLVTKCSRLLRRENELCIVDGDGQLATYINAKNYWKTKDDAPEVQVVGRRTVGQGYQLGRFRVPQIARSGNGNFLAVAWWDSTGGDQLFARVFDLTTGALLADEVVVTGAFEPRLIAVGSVFVLGYATDGPSPYSIKFKSMDMGDSNPVWSSAATLANNDASVWFDIYPLDADEFVAVHIVDATGVVDLTRWTADALTLVDTEADIRTGKVVSNSIGVFVGSAIYVAYWNATDQLIEVKIHSSSTLAQSSAAQTIAAAATAVAPRCVTVGERAFDSAYVVYDIRAAAGSNTAHGVGMRFINSDGTLSGTTRDVRNVTIASRPYLNNGRTYLNVVTGEGSISVAQGGIQQDQRAVVIIDVIASPITGNDRPRPVARFAEGEVSQPRNAGGLNAVYTPTFQGNDATAYVPFLLLDPTENTPVADDGRATSIDVVGIKFRQLDYTDQQWAGWTEFGKNTAIPAGMLHQYDGDLVREAGFVYYPWIDQIDLAAGGTLVSGSLHEYCACYVVMDNAGRLWRSRPSIIKSATPSGGNLSIRLRIPYYTITSHELVSSTSNPVGIEIYRRTASSDPFVRLKNLASGDVAVANDKSATTYLEVTDTGGSHSILDQPNLYTTGGVLEAFTPPPCTQSVVFDNRLWIFDGNTLWYSREMLNDEGPAFHPAQTIEVGDEADVTALAVMDSSLVIFKAESIFFMQGNGPDDTGANPAYSIPQRVMSPVGCVDIRSVVTGGKGIYFQSRRGIERLGRDLSQEYIGERVEDTFAANDTITAAVHVQSDNEIRFSIAAAGTNTASILVYDETTDVWTKDLLQTTALAVAKPISAVSVAGSYYWLENNSARHYKETGTYIDKFWDGDSIEDARINLLFETGDITLGSPTPTGERFFWRAVLFARESGDHELSIEIAMNQSDTYGTPKEFSESTIDTFEGLPIEVAEVLPPPQRARSIRFRVKDRVVDPQATFATAGPIFYAITLEAGQEGGVSRVAVAQRK